MEPPASNTSGEGKAAAVPAEIRGWNWGAFLLNWIWGIGNGTFIALLMFVPLVNVVMPFVLGAKGNEWAWRNRRWQSVAEFKSAQRKWAWAGLLVTLVAIPSCIALPLSALRHNEVFRNSFAAIQSNPEVLATLGHPIEAGLLVTGNISTNGPDGTAALQYSVQGPEAEGTAYVYAARHTGQWDMKRIVVEVPSLGKRISVIADDAPSI